MKAVILAGGLGTRISEETTVRPKPMIEIGGMPVLWHILKTYSHHGINDFIICLGYKGYMIKEYFANYFLEKWCQGQLQRTAPASIAPAQQAGSMGAPCVSPPPAGAC